MVARVEHGDRAVWGIAFGLVTLAVLASLILHGQLSDVLGQIPWFLRAYAAVLGPSEVLAVALLAWRATVLRTRRSALLAAAYAFSAPLVIENLSSLPGIFGPRGMFAHQTPPWCWLVWHAGWAAFIVLFAWTPDRPVRRPLTIAAVGLVPSLAFGFVALHAEGLPPVLGTGDTNTPLLLAIGWSTVALLAAAALGIGTLRDTKLDAFLLVAVVAIALDEIFVLTTAVRFSAGTYLARTLGAVNAGMVMVAIAVEFGGLIRSQPGSFLERIHRAAHIRREQTLQHVAQTVPQLVWIADPNGHIEWYNQRWFEYTGQTPDIAAEAGWLGVQHPDDSDAARRWIDSVRTGIPVTLESRLRSADGSYRWFVTRFEPMYDRAQHVVTWYGSATDIELRRRRR